MTEISENITPWVNVEYSRSKSHPGSTIFNQMTIHNVELQAKVIFIHFSYIILLACLLVSHVLHINPLSFIVPAQENGFDCGMFVCHYAFAMYHLQDVDIKFADVVKEQPPLIN
jgi:hypothetical protein